MESFETYNLGFGLIKNPFGMFSLLTSLCFIVAVQSEKFIDVETRMDML